MFAFPNSLRRRFHSLILAGLVTFIGTGTTQTAAPQVAVAQTPKPERLQPSLDLAQFQDAKRVHYLDLSYAVPLPVLSNGVPPAEILEIVLDLRIYKNDSLWATKLWKLEEKKSLAAPVASRRELVDRLRYLLAGPGTYRAVLHTRNAQQPAGIDSATAVLQTREFSHDRVEVSDVILASEIKKAAAPAPASSLQNAYEVFPNPRHIYGEPVPVLYYYFEAYNLNTGLEGNSYKSYWRVENESGARVADLGQNYRTRKKTNDFSVEMGSVNVAALPTGIYAFVYGIADSVQSLQTSRRKKFYIYNSALPASDNFAAQPAEKMLAHAGAAELDDEFGRMQHIVLKDEKKMYQSLDNVEAKKRLLLALWEAHQPEEYPNAAAFRQAYLARAREAEENFTTVMRPGWKSDQGRVFILYGPPSNVEREPSNPTVKPYEIWRYDEIQGGVIFVFADRTGFKNYELLHSTHRNELQNPDWERLVTLEAERRQGLQ